MPDPVSHLLQRASWFAEKLFKQRGALRTMFWCTETEDGRRQMFESACTTAEAGPIKRAGMSRLRLDSAS